MASSILVAVRRTDHPVAIMEVVTDDGHGLVAEATDEYISALVAKSNFGDAIDWHRCEIGQFPEDRTFRNAWRSDGKNIEPDLEIAKTIKLDHLRSERAKKFVELDALFSRAQGQKDDNEATAIEAKRQLLRDLPDVTEIKSIEELKAIALPNTEDIIDDRREINSRSVEVKG